MCVIVPMRGVHILRDTTCQTSIAFDAMWIFCFKNIPTMMKQSDRPAEIKVELQCCDVLSENSQDI